MGLVISPLQPLSRQVSVYLCGHQVRVPQQFLHTPEVGSGIKHVRSVAVSQLVGREVWIQSGHGQIPLQPQLQNTC